MVVETDKAAIADVANSRYVERVYPSREALREALERGEQLSLYVGIDPTGSHLHLGHSVQLLFLRELQKLGHHIILLIGDFTGRVGDPTGKTQARQQLSKEELHENCRNYAEQASAILNFSGSNPVELRYNSEWLAEMDLGDTIELMAQVTVGQMIQRDMFQERMRKEQEIYLHEFLYPLLQGYDSVAMNIDGEVGGNDQTFNMLVGRDLLRTYNNKEKLVITTKLLEDPDTGRKLMSKSEGDYVPLDADPTDMFGRVMALPDSAIMSVFKLCTKVEEERLESVRQTVETDPREAKAQLAGEIVEMYHGTEAAEEAAKEFDRVFREGGEPSQMREFRLEEADIEGKLSLAELLVRTGFTESKSEAKRLIKQGGVKIDDIVQKEWDKNTQLEKGQVIQVGKRRFVRIV